jgi:hypothetical protein
MEPGSSRVEPHPAQALNRLADIAGTLIAVLTLIIPVAAISYFSLSSLEILSPASYPPATGANSKLSIDQ